MGNEQKVADKRTVVRNPLHDDPNAGIIVAAGDPLPAGVVGVVSNTPNKVDAAANYDDADAADKATNARPATTVVQAGEGVAAEIAERVAANRSNWFGENDDLARQASSPAEHPDAGSPAAGAPDASASPAEATPSGDDEPSSRSSRRSGAKSKGA